MTVPSGTSSSRGSSSPAGEKQSKPSPRPSLERFRGRWLPLVWQITGTLITVGGYAAGTIDIAEVAGHIALLSLLTAGYLSWVVRDRRRPQDTYAIFGYLAYAAGLGFVSAPSVFAFDTRITTPTRALGALFLGSLLALSWAMYIEYIAEDGDD